MENRSSMLSGVNENLDNLTICIPAFDRAKFITACLDQLEFQETDRLKVLVVDTGSQDGTPELIETQIKNGWWKPPSFRPFLDMRLVRLPEIKGKGAGVVAAMEYFQKTVDTEFMMRIEPDILIPPNALRPMMGMFREDPTLGMLAIGYCPTKDHVPTDCTMLRMCDVRAITWQWSKAGCDCMHAFYQLNSVGKKVKFHPELKSRHLRFL